MASNRPLMMHSPIASGTGGGQQAPTSVGNLAQGLKPDAQRNVNLLNTSPGASAQNISANSLGVRSFIQEDDRTLAGNNRFEISDGHIRSGRPNVGAPGGESLVEMLHQLFRTSQEEMRREMRTMREDIGSLSEAVASSQAAPTYPRDFAQFGGMPIPACSRNPALPTHSAAIKPQDWKVSYDGKGSVSDFLFKLDTLCERTQCSPEQLMANFHLFLSGRAEEWYWLFTRQNPNATYPFVCYSIKREFGTLKSDHEIRMEISMRRQKANEPYDGFHTDIVALNARLREPMSEILLIDILKRNVGSNLKLMLFNTEVRTLHDLRDVARKAEQVLKENRSLVPHYPGRVNETLAITPEEVVGEDDPQVDALNFRKPDYSGIQCWNCDRMGHSYIYCEEPIRRPFCFKCGQKDVVTPKCLRDHRRQGNRNPNEKTIGESRSAS